jgi:asparagine synthase (glutamine-hydrolysing)
MCGIVGIIDRTGNPVRPFDVEAMASTLAHRGPDGEGVYVDGPVGLGHRRLSIIDLDAGQQPLSNEDGTVWVTYNGEIYNHQELAKELIGYGHQFKTRCDTEVIVHAYEQWGADCVQRFNGMFAFAVYDVRSRTVFLARDRIGIKPLFYLATADTVAFASELQALERTPGVTLRVNPTAIDEFLQLQYIPAPSSIYRDVWKLQPGHTVTISLAKNIVGPQQCYWDVSFAPDFSTTEEQWLEQLDDTIRQAVRSQLMADVPFGAFLSGGADSSLVVAYMSELLDEPVRTFSIGFDEEDFSELKYAEIAAKRNGTQHYGEVVRADCLEILPDLVRHYGEPMGDSSALPTYYVSQLARQHVKMVLSGDGGDECFAGYRRYMKSMPVWTHDGTLRSRLRRFGANMLRATRLRRPQSTARQWWIGSQSIFSSAERNHLLNGRGENAGPIPLVLQDSFNKARDWNFCHQLQYFDLKHYLPNAVLTKVDVASMYHGLEVRVPLLDHHVVELAARIPVEMNLQRKSRSMKTLGGKRMLKLVAEQFYDRGEETVSGTERRNGVRNRLLTAETSLSSVWAWEDRNEQRMVGWCTMC